MNVGITTIANNLGMGLENIILLVVILGGIIFYAKDFKLGVVMHLLMTGLLFMWFYELEMNYVPSLVACLMFLVILSLSLYAVGKTAQRGAVI